MKNRYITSILLFTFLLLASCSVEKLFEEEPTEAERLVADSPYTFDNYELYVLDDRGDSDFTNDEVEADMNRYLKGATFTFNENGSGSVFNPEDGAEPMTWSLTNGALTTIASESGETSTYRDFKIGISEISFAGRLATLHFRDSIAYTITHTGKYSFK